MTEETTNKTTCPQCGGVTDADSGPGSVSQWLFRNDLCRCALTNSGQQTQVPPDARTSTTKRIIKTLTVEMEKELAVNHDKFPIRRYKPLSLVGAGAAGTVYRCRDRLLRKKVAIKILHDAADEQLVAFQKEAKATCKLRHSNVISVLDFGVTESGTPFMVMELFDGMSLAQMIEIKGPLDVPTSLTIFIRVCDGLAEAHKQAIFHRDVKTSNILVKREGDTIDVRIIDFGLVAVKQNQEATRRTQGMTIVGTPHYMSPDQIEGRSFDARSEVYSVGCALFETLTGRTVFDGDTALDVMNKHATLPPPTLSERLPGGFFPKDLEEVVASCLSKDPALRPESMSYLRSMLSNLEMNFTYSKPVFVPDVSVPIASKKVEKWKIALCGVLVTCCFAAAIFFFTPRKPAHRAHVHKHVVTAAAASSDQIVVVPEPQLGRRWNTETKNGHKVFVATGAVTDGDLDPLIGTNCTHLVLKASSITSAGLDRLAYLPLETLDLSMTNLDDRAVPAIAKITTLKDLSISLTKITDDGLAGLAPLKALSRLDVDHLGITDKGFASIVAQWPEMKILNVSNTKITSLGLADLGKLQRLQNLELAALNLSADNIRAVVSLPNLEVLNLNHARFSPELLDEFPKMKRLRFFLISEIPGVGAARYTRLQAQFGDRCRLQCFDNLNNSLPAVQPLVDLIGAEEEEK